jgi:hypothetical protein
MMGGLDFAVRRCNNALHSTHPKASILDLESLATDHPRSGS